VMAYCDDERAAFALAEHVRRGGFVWLVDVVQAYLTVAVFYDLRQTDFAQVARELQDRGWTLAAEHGRASGREHVIPCCYGLGPDLARVADHAGRSVEDVIALHSGARYTVYAIGFCPGFPYLGYLPQPLVGVPRLPAPRLHVEAGSVGLTGRQTGIYTEVRPGGWNIIGRTPLRLVDVADGFFPLRTGDRVRFRRVDENEYRELEGKRLGEG
jgi:inhibitor of KinA